MATTEEVNPVRDKDSESPGSAEASASNGVKKLAALARISVSDTDLEQFTAEFDSIIAYMGQLETLELEKAGSEKPVNRNVLRADGEPHESGKYTEVIAAQFPKRKGDALSVKQIISHD